MHKKGKFAPIDIGFFMLFEQKLCIVTYYFIVGDLKGVQTPFQLVLIRINGFI